MQIVGLLMMWLICFPEGYQGDTYILLKLLLPGVVKRVYNLNNKQLVKLFSQVCDTMFGRNVTQFLVDMLHNVWQICDAMFDRYTTQCLAEILHNVWQV